MWYYLISLAKNRKKNHLNAVIRFPDPSIGHLNYFTSTNLAKTLHIMMSLFPEVLHLTIWMSLQQGLEPYWKWGCGLKSFENLETGTLNNYKLNLFKIILSKDKLLWYLSWFRLIGFRVSPYKLSIILLFWFLILSLLLAVERHSYLNK